MPASISQWRNEVLFDPQTSGGLLVTVRQEQADIDLHQFHRNSLRSTDNGTTWKCPERIYAANVNASANAVTWDAGAPQVAVNRDPHDAHYGHVFVSFMTNDDDAPSRHPAWASGAATKVMVSGSEGSGDGSPCPSLKWPARPQFVAARPFPTLKPVGSWWPGLFTAETGAVWAEFGQNHSSWMVEVAL